MHFSPSIRSLSSLFLFFSPSSVRPMRKLRVIPVEWNRHFAWNDRGYFFSIFFLFFLLFSLRPASPWNHPLVNGFDTEIFIKIRHNIAQHKYPLYFRTSVAGSIFYIITASLLSRNRAIRSNVINFYTRYKRKNVSFQDLFLWKQACIYAYFAARGKRNLAKFERHN